MKSLFLAVIFIGNLLSAKTTEPITEHPINLKIVYGDKTTEFSVAKTKNGGQVTLLGAKGTPTIKDISKSDFDFISAKLIKLPGASNKKEFCSRNYIEVNFENTKTLGCMGSANKVAQQLQQTANLLSVLF